MESLVIGGLLALVAWQEIRGQLVARRTDVRERELLNRVQSRNLGEYEALRERSRQFSGRAGVKVVEPRPCPGPDPGEGIAALVIGGQEYAALNMVGLDEAGIAGGVDAFNHLMGEE